MLIDPAQILASRFVQAITSVFGEAHRATDPLIRVAQNAKFGDFQSNVAMSLAKLVGQPPREVAASIIDALELEDLCSKTEMAGPGFINLFLKPSALPELLSKLDSESLGVERSETPTAPVVIDLVGVNIAKQMHVGHLRSSIIGDSFCRILDRLGHRVIPQNHLGDWGLQIAMVITALRRTGINLDELDIAQLETAYRRASLDCKSDDRALEVARKHGLPHRIVECEEQVAGAREALSASKATLIALQSGDPEIVEDWNRIIAITLDACYEIYDILDLTVSAEHNRGESFYRSELAEVVEEFEKAGLAYESQGATVVDIPDEEVPLLIRKSDGGFLYATTDLAAIRYRIFSLGASRIVYVVDARQREHFRKLFAAVRRIGWDQRPDGSRVQLEHVAFGAVCGEDGKPLKTRSGENIRLRDLLLEAIDRAKAVVTEKNPDLPDEEKDAVARAVGIGAVKYADLSSHLSKDYIFSWDRMLAFEGNTGAYLQNQYVRIRSIGRKAPADVQPDAAFLIESDEEKDLALLLLRFPDTIATVADTLEPHRLCQYLYELAGSFSSFYTQCPILKADTPDQRDARLRLARLTERILAQGLELLGIRTLERM